MAFRCSFSLFLQFLTHLPNTSSGRSHAVSIFCLEGWAWTTNGQRTVFSFQMGLADEKTAAPPHCPVREMSCCSLRHINTTQADTACRNVWPLCPSRLQRVGHVPGINACRYVSPDKGKCHFLHCSKRNCRWTQASACTIANGIVSFSLLLDVPWYTSLPNKSLHF